LISLDECIEKKAIQRFIQGPSQVAESLLKARELVEEAKKNMRIGSYNSVIILAYSAAFTAARALLFRDGFREKTHECLIAYLRVRHKELPEYLINQLDHFRSYRHGVLYDVGFRPTVDECKEAVSFAEEMISTVEKALFNKTK